MREIDLKSVLVAGAIGAVIMFLSIQFETEQKLTTGEAMGHGFIVGIGVQIGVRILGVS